VYFLKFVMRSWKIETTNWPGWREWWRALRWVHLTLTLVIALTLAGSFVSYEKVLHQGHPWLPPKEAHAPCAFCGMTRSFCAISNGRFEEAVRWNRGGIVLYASGWLWLAGSTLLVAKRLQRRKIELT